ncbi:hypothetical protein TNCV_2066751 [Trichonephila clavipes]|uniref:Uncharacterized protein n=1 Tax=Trichonephila clavipes TaxID=2585209 RepID=A0A8X6W2R3_TRICX|nr:hypothetical protein TNCV_2066751 [Trichonephila clavipes]
MSDSYINVKLKCCKRAIDNGTRNFAPWSSDKHDTCAVAPPFLASTPKGGRLNLDRLNVQRLWTRTHGKPGTSP